MTSYQPRLLLASSSRRKVWLAVLSVTALIAATVVPSPAAGAEAGFSDSADAGVHQTAVETLAGWGYFEGTECDTDTFCPQDPIKRWVMAVWLVRALGYKPYNTDTSRFADVSTDEWWSPYAERIAQLEVTTGCKTGPLRYCPDQPVTRGQMATFLVRALKIEEAPSAGFVDTEGDTHEANIDALATAGIHVGMQDRAPQLLPEQTRHPRPDGYLPAPSHPYIGSGHPRGPLQHDGRQQMGRQEELADGRPTGGLGRCHDRRRRPRHPSRLGGQWAGRSHPADTG